MTTDPLLRALRADDVVGSEPKRYARDQDDDGKSGYRIITLSGSQMETRLVNLLQTRGGQPAGLLIHELRQSGAAVFLALGRLQERGLVQVDQFLFVTYCPPKRRRSIWGWLFNRGSVHPALVAIACFALTTGGCAAWIATARAQHPDTFTR